MTAERIKLQVDCSATTDLYPERYCNLWCQCCGCTNFKSARETHFPSRMVTILRELCIDPFEPYYLTRTRRGRIPVGQVRYTGHYYAIGSLVNGGPKRRVKTEDGCWLWPRVVLATDLPEYEHLWGDRTEPLVAVHFSLIMPWMLSHEEEINFGC
jgi:hypothetical protein